MKLSEGFPQAPQLTGSTVHLDEWVGPHLADNNGHLRTCNILELMDVVGVVAASRYAKAPVVTASIDAISMKEPISVGSRVTMSATVAFTSQRSIGISVVLDHYPAKQRRQIKRTIEGYMVFVALAENGKPMEVPQFRPESPDEERRFHEGRVRHEFRKRIKDDDLSAVDFEKRDIFAAPAVIKEILKFLPSSLKATWEMLDQHQPRSHHHSYIHKIEPVFEGQLNFNGTLYGGTLMNWVEGTANLSAQAHLDGEAVTLTSLHGLNFIAPVQKHVFLHLRARVVHSSAGELTIMVKVLKEDPYTQQTEESLRAFLTYRPLKKTKIPRLKDLAQHEKVLYKEVEHRLVLQKQILANSRTISASL